MKNAKTIKKLFISFLCLLASFTLLGVVFALSNSLPKIAGVPINQGPRLKYSFNYDWQFAKGEGTINSGSDLATDPLETYTCVANSTNPFSQSYSTSGNNCWSNVSLAHTFNDTDTFDNFTESGMNGERSTYTGSSWYKKEFYVPAEYVNKKIYIEFEAARQVAEVYINGNKVTAGTYQNGFIPFGYDLTSYLTFGANNYITVMVDNSFPYYLNGTSVIPWHDSHWHPNYGGLYRNSYLYVVDNLHLTLPLYSFLETEGTYVYTSNENGVAKTATVNVDAQVENSYSTSQTFKVRSTVYNANDVAVLTFESADVTLEPNTKQHVLLSGNLENAVRWSTQYPYLYNVVTQIIQNGTVIDNNSIDMGIRTYRFTTDYGFYLNENYIELNGWGQKSTMEYAGLGAAYPDWMTDMVIKLMKDAGGNYIRWGHVAGSPAQIDAANKYGLIVTQPGVDGEGTYESSYTTTSIKLRAEAFRDMLIYFRNNPSIVMWEIGNQSSSMNSTLSGTNLSGISGSEDLGKTSTTLAELLYFFAGKYDYGNRTGATNGTIPNAGTYANTILSSASDRILTIRSATSGTSPYVEVTEVTNAQSGGIISGKPAIESEYNRYEARRGIWDTYTNSFTAQNSYHFTSEGYAVSQVSQKNAVLNVTSNMGGANWIFSDSTSHGRVNSEVARVSGEVDATMLPKEAYFTNKVLFNASDATYIIGHWNYAPGTVKTVYVIAPKNIATVKLYVNSVEYTGNVTNKYLWTFNNVAYVENSTITAIGYDVAGNVIVGSSSSKASHGTPTALRFTMINNPEGIKANGSDIVLVDVEVVDANGNRCTSYDGETLNDLITFNLTGDTDKFIWRGGYNSGRENSTNVNTLYAEAGITRIAIKTTMQGGTVSLSATSAQGLTSPTPLAITSNNISNTDANTGFTGVSSVLNSTSYNLTPLTDPDYGDGDILGIPTEKIHLNSTILIKNYSYTGTDVQTNKIADAFGIGSKIYSDEAVTFTKIPYKYYNAEYILLPNADKATLAVDFINFEAKRDIDVYVLRDPAIVNNPSWLSSYTKLTEKIIGGNGIEYDVYKLTVAKNTAVTIGGNVDAVSDLNGGVNQIVIVKETAKVNSSTLFNETFDDFDADSVRNGFNSVTPADTSITVDTTLNGNTLNLVDSSTSATTLTYMQKSFVGFDKFKVRFKAYLVEGDSQFNHWLRIWFTDGPFVRNNTVDDKSNVGIETYLDNTTTGEYVSYRENGTSNTVKQLISKLALNEWHEFEYTIDTTTGKFFVTLLDEGNVQQSAEYTFSRPEVKNINNIVFGTCVWGMSNYYVDDIEVIPVIDNVIESVTVNEVPVTTFDKSTTDYYISNINNDSVITLTTNEFYKSSSYTYSAVEDVITLVVTDVADNTYTYKFYDIYKNPVFDGWTLNADPGTSILVETIDGFDSIAMLDTVEGNAAYITRDINPLSSLYRVSFDFYMRSSDNMMSTWNRIWLLQGEMLGYDIKTNLGPETYLHEYYDNVTNRTYTTALVRYLLENNSEYIIRSYELDPAIMFQENTWREYELLINEQTKTYSVYIDNMLVFADIPFYQSNVVIDHIAIGTRKSGEGAINIKNFQLENIFTSPLEGISYDGTPISNYVPSIMTYDVYAEERLSENTEITLTHANAAGDPIITKDYLAQTVTIDIKDLNNVSYIYTVHVLPSMERPSSFADLQSLLITIDNDYISTNYTTRTWANLMTEVNNARLLTEDSSIEEISYACYHITKALESLVRITATNDKSSFINIVRISNDILNNYSFDLVLENNKNVYNDDSSLRFRSVPKKYMNANYFLMPKSLLSIGGEIQLTAKRNISILVFKDRNAGEVSIEGQTAECTNVNNCFVDTGDIVTAVSGDNTIVYKVYRRDYAVGSSVLIDAKYLLTNRITNNTNIVAVKGSDEVSANAFLIDDTSNYLTLEDFNNTWENYVYDTRNNTENNRQYLETVGGETSIRMESNAGNSKINSNGSLASARSFIETTRQFAKLTGKFKVSYSAYVSPVSTDYDQNYLRAAWITNGPATDWEVGTKDIKTHVLNETYFGLPNIPSAQKNTYSLVYRYSTASGSNGNSNNYLTAIPSNTWINNIEYELDVRNQIYDVKVDNTVVGNNLAFIPQIPPFTYADHIMFGTRATGFSQYWFRDVVIEPIEDDLISAIKVNNNVVVNNDSQGYNSITKDYLYSAEDLTTKTVAVVDGANVGTSTIQTATDYTNLDLTSSTTYGSVQLNHRVYYEISCSRAVITSAIEEANDLIELEYTVDSWENLQVALTAAINLLDDHEVSCDTVRVAETNLVNALENLIKKYNFDVQYNGTMAPGNTLTRPVSDDINVTADSSITLDVSFERHVGSNYSYQDAPHARKLVSSEVLPAGTFITMIDNSLETPKYYYYEVSADDVTNNKVEYLFSDFTLMAGLSKYSNLVYYNSTTGYVTENFIFMIDFGEVELKLANGAYTLKVESDISGELIDMNPVTYNIYDEHNEAFVLVTTGDESHYATEVIDLHLQADKYPVVINGKSVYETKLYDTKIGVIFRLYDSINDTQLTMPPNTKMTLGDKYCYVKNNECRLMLGSVTTQVNVDITLSFGINNNLVPGTYNLKAILINSIDGLLEGTIHDINDTFITIKEKVNADFKITLDSYNVIDYGTTYTLNYSLTDNIENSYVVVSLAKRGVTDFEEVDLNVYTAENLIEYAPNKYNLGDILTWDATVRDTVEKGTYMLTFDLYNQDEQKLSTINKYFIVK